MKSIPDTVARAGGYLRTLGSLYQGKTKFLGLFVMLMGAIALSQEKEAVPAGQKAFLDLKCTTCHGVTAAGITGNPAKKSPDLSVTGDKRSADWVYLYIKKQETINGKKHLIPFHGTDKQLRDIGTWLESLKSPKE